MAVPPDNMKQYNRAGSGGNCDRGVAGHAAAKAVEDGG
jgi:hypothetical protein